MNTSAGIMTRPILISLVILGGCSPSERTPSPPEGPAFKLELHPSDETDAEAYIELGAVDSSMELPFGCHILFDLMPFTLKGQQVKGASFSATQIRFLLPWNHRSPQYLEQLDGARFENEDLGGRHRFEIVNLGIAGLPNPLPVSLDRLTLKRTDNWHFHAEITGSFALDPLEEIPIQALASLEIGYLHWPPEGAPNERLISMAKDLLGGPALPERVIASIGDSRVLVENGETKADQHRIMLLLREQEFAKWEEEVNSRYEMTKVKPEELPVIPSDWGEHFTDTNVTYCKIEREGFPLIWLSIAPQSRSLQFYSPRGEISPP